MTIDTIMAQIETYYGNYDNTKLKSFVRAYLIKDYKEDKFDEILKAILYYHKANFGSPCIATIEECIKNCLKVLKIGGKIVLINMNPSEETKVPEGENYIDLCFGCYQILQKYLKPVQRICVPVFKEFDQTRIKIAKENKTLLGTLRDLMIFEKI